MSKHMNKGNQETETSSKEEGAINMASLYFVTLVAAHAPATDLGFLPRLWRAKDPDLPLLREGTLNVPCALIRFLSMILKIPKFSICLTVSLNMIHAA